MLAFAGQTLIAESAVTVTTAIEGIDQTNRTITLKRPAGGSVEIKAPEQMQGFNGLRVGDQVTVTYFEAALISLRKPDDPDPKKLQNIKVGDMVDVRYYESLSRWHGRDNNGGRRSSGLLTPSSARGVPAPLHNGSS